MSLNVAKGDHHSRRPTCIVLSHSMRIRLALSIKSSRSTDLSPVNRDGRLKRYYAFSKYMNITHVLCAAIVYSLSIDYEL